MLSSTVIALIGLGILVGPLWILAKLSETKDNMGLDGHNKYMEEWSRNKINRSLLRSALLYETVQGGLTI